MSAAVMRGESSFTLAMNRNSTLSFSSSSEVSRSRRGECRDEFAHTRDERGGPSHHFLSEPGEVFGCVRPIREQMPDLRVLFTRRHERVDAVGPRPWLGILLHVWQVHGVLIHTL